MSAIFGLANLDATSYQYVHTAGEDVIYEAARMYTAARLEGIRRFESVFVQAQTTNHTELYKLPGSGRMNRRATGVRGPAVRAYGGWTVNFPLYDFEESVVTDFVQFAYMTPGEYQNAVDTVINRYVDERRWQLLHALLDDQAGSSETFVDPQWGSLSVVPLANGDSVTYPPVLGSTTEATEDHYSESGYADSAISDTNNPLVTLRDELVEHFGTVAGGENIAVFCNNADLTYLEDLTDYDPVEDMNIRSGANVNIPVNLPTVPGTIRGRSNGTWVVEWRFMPDNYLLAVHLDAPPPLVERVDPAETGLQSGLVLRAEDEEHPLMSAIYGARFGLAVRNRLNGAVMELGTGGTYTVPTAYT